MPLNKEIKHLENSSGQQKSFCQWSFATCDVLLPSEKLTVKLAGSNITTKHFCPSPSIEENGKSVTLCNILIQLNVLAAYLSTYGCVEEVTPIREADRTPHGDYILYVVLNREGSQAIPLIISYKDQQMMVVIEDRRSLCWSCKQLGHLARTCSQETPSNNNNNNKGKNTSSTTNPTLKPGEHQDNSENGWTQVTWAKKEPPAKTTTIEATLVSATKTATKTTAETIETSAAEKNKQPLSPPPHQKKQKRGKKKNTEG